MLQKNQMEERKTAGSEIKLYGEVIIVRVRNALKKLMSLLREC